MHVLTARTRDDFGSESGSLYSFCLKSGYMLYMEAARGPGLVADASPISMSKESVMVHSIVPGNSNRYYFQLTKAKIGQ